MKLAKDATPPRQVLPEVFTAGELAEWIGYESGWVRRHTVWKGCPHIPLGNATLFIQAEFMTWLRGRLEIVPTDAKGKEKCPGSPGQGGQTVGKHQQHIIDELERRLVELRGGE